MWEVTGELEMNSTNKMIRWWLHPLHALRCVQIEAKSYFSKKKKKR